MTLALAPAARPIALPARGLRWAIALLLVAGMVRAHFALGGLACPLRATTGVPCPLCGSTTAVTSLASGDLRGAAVANPFALGGLAWLAAQSLRRHVVFVSTSTVVLLLAASWAWQLQRVLL